MATSPVIPEGFEVESHPGQQQPAGPEPTIKAESPSFIDYARRMLFGGPQGETALGRRFPSMSGAVIGDQPVTELPTVRFEEAIPSESQLGNVQGAGIGATARNVGRGVASGLSDLTTPTNAAMLAATGGAGAVPAEAMGWGAAGARGARAALNAYFAAQMVHGAGQGAKQAYDAAQHGDYETAAKLAGHASVDALLASLGVKSAAHEAREVGKSKVPTPTEPAGPYNAEPRQVESGSSSEPPAEDLQPPAAPPTTKAERFGERTPNPPTAYHPTTPETPQTISLQLQQLADGQRRAVMIPRGSSAPDNYPEGSAIANDGMGNIYVFDPQRISRSEIKSAAQNNRLPEILGHSDMGMGVPDKTALEGEPAAVVVRAPDGTEVHSAATDETNAPAAITAASQLQPPGGTLSIEPIESAISNRKEESLPSGEGLPSALPSVSTQPPSIRDSRQAAAPPTSQAPAKTKRQAAVKSEVSGSPPRLKAEASITSILKAYAAMDAAERKTLQPEVRKRVMAARGKAYRWTPEARELAQKFFNVQPTGGDFAAPKGVE